MACDNERPAKKLKRSPSQGSISKLGELRSLSQRFSLSHYAETPADWLAQELSAAPTRAPADSALKLHSLQRMLSSQRLHTPLPLPVAAPACPQEQPEDCGFAIHCSQTYFRRPSQDAAIDSPQLQRSADSSPPATLPSSPVPPVDVERLRSGTPDLGTQEYERAVSPSQPARLFHIFRPKSQRKRIFIVRHGESTYNAATVGKAWQEPNIFDAFLTAKGRSQAVQLCTQLPAEAHAEHVLWVTSPLTRAIETMLLSCPSVEQLGRPGHPRVAVRKESAEQLITSGDVGRPASQLRKAFPQLDGALASLPEHWWFNPSANYYDGVSKRFTVAERKCQLQARIGKFKCWLHEQPEKTIVAFGHCMFWKEFISSVGGDKNKRMKNCEVVSLLL